MQETMTFKEEFEQAKRDLIRDTREVSFNLRSTIEMLDYRLQDIQFIKSRVISIDDRLKVLEQKVKWSELKIE
jgi:hypothetical protein